tara:strand:+ start:290 stop:646 length:357 start_codon:yes stop_codon:yes gene_type:complete
MAHYAKIEDDVVTQVLVAEQEYIDTKEGTWIQTSYNTRGGKHYAPNSSTEDDGTPLRKNYAGVGDTYDAVRDAFISPKTYPSWVLNEDTCNWEAPVTIPDDGKQYQWNEPTTNWVEVE